MRLSRFLVSSYPRVLAASRSWSRCLLKRRPLTAHRRPRRRYPRLAASEAGRPRAARLPAVARRHDGSPFRARQLLARPPHPPVLLPPAMDGPESLPQLLPPRPRGGWGSTCRRLSRPGSLHPRHLGFRSRRRQRVYRSFLHWVASAPTRMVIHPDHAAGLFGIFITGGVFWNGSVVWNVTKDSSLVRFYIEDEHVTKMPTPHFRCLVTQKGASSLLALMS